jgi:hypothetical protein
MNTVLKTIKREATENTAGNVKKTEKVNAVRKQKTGTLNTVRKTKSE